jgi:anti-anti-sigma factor
MDVKVAVDRVAGHVVVRASGEFDVASTATLAPALRQAYAADVDVDLDLRGTTFCDVTFLRLVLDAANRLHQSGHQLHVLNPPPVLLRMISALNVDDLEIA